EMIQTNQISNTDPGFELLGKNGGKLEAEASLADVNYIRLRRSSSMNYRKWHIVVGIAAKSNNTLRIYIDGALAAQTSMATMNISLNNSRALYIGVERNLTRYFVGAIDDIRIYNYALSDSAIRVLYTAGGW